MASQPKNTGSSGASQTDLFALRNKLRKFTVQLQQRWWIVLLITLACTFAGAVWAYRQPPAYLSTAQMVVGGKITVPNGATYSEELTYFLGTQAEFMESNEVRKRALERVASTAPELAQSPVTLSVGRQQNTAIFDLAVVGPNGPYTQQYLEAVMTEYSAMRREMRSAISDDTLAAMTQELKRLDTDIAQGHAEMIDFEKSNNVGFLQEQGNSAAEYLVTLNRSLANLKNEYQLLESLDLDPGLDRNQKHEMMVMAQRDRAAAATAGKSEPDGIDSEKADVAQTHQTGAEGQLAKAQQDLQALIVQREDFAKVLRPEHPTMIDLNQKIDDQKRIMDALRNQGVDEMKMRQESLRLEIANLEKTITEWQGKAVDVGKRMADYDKIKQKVDRDEEVYRQQSTNLQNIDVNKNIDQDMISVLEHATDPQSVRLGMWRTMAKAAGGGLLAGLALLAIFALCDDRILSASDLEMVFEEQLLAQIPSVEETGSKKRLTVLMEKDERHAFAESLRSLRSSLVFLPAEGAAPRSFLITSAVPAEGKSTVATNLAITFAFAGATVLLVDGDLRRGRLHEQLGVENGWGFADILAEERPGKWREAVKLSRIPGLSLLPRGSLIQNPGEGFLKRGANTLLSEIYGVYDYVIIDSAPVMVADDTTSLAPKIDATIFVVRYGSSSMRTSRKALELLHRRQANVLGLVCNDVEVSAQEYYYYRYPEYYGTMPETKGPDPSSPASVQDDYEITLRPETSWINLELRGIWHYRDLLLLMVWRDFSARYRQTILGPLWFILQPLLMTLVFTVIFGKVAGLSTDGLPPLLFYLCGQLGWNYLAQNFNSNSTTLVTNAALFSKVYFPRLIVPISSLVSNLFALAIQMATFGVFFAYFKTTAAAPTYHMDWRVVFLPLVIIQTAVLSLGVGLLMSALTAKYRDLVHVTSLLIQIWMYATPVILPLSKILEKCPPAWQWLVALNPMVAIVETLRLMLLGTGTVTAGYVIASVAMTLAILAGGLLLFGKVEKTFVDTV